MSTHATTPSRTAKIARSAVRRGDRGLSAVERGPGRRALLAAIPRVLPRRLDKLAARGVDATIELRIRGANGGQPDRFALTIARERLTVTRGPAPKAGATITVGAADLVRLGSGAVGWPTLLGNGRLELGGDPFVGLRFPMLFRLVTR